MKKTWIEANLLAGSFLGCYNVTVKIKLTGRWKIRVQKTTILYIEVLYDKKTHWVHEKNITEVTEYINTCGE